MLYLFKQLDMSWHVRASYRLDLLLSELIHTKRFEKVADLNNAFFTSKLILQMFSSKGVY